MTPSSTVIGLDVGQRRIGLARGDSGTRLAFPLQTLNHTPNIMDQLKVICSHEHAKALVVGLPRGLDGQETSQTAYARDFAARLKQALGYPVYLIDEAATSVQAETILKQQSKPYTKADIDALAATYILQNYFDQQGVEKRE